MTNPKTIKTWRERCDELHSPMAVVSSSMIQQRMQEEIDELRAALKSAHEPEARLTDMTFKAHEGEPFEATAQFQGDAVKMWSIAMVQWFREKGGVNYVACDLRDPTTGETYEITMQKAGGRTPAQDLAEMRAQLNRRGDADTK